MICMPESDTHRTLKQLLEGKMKEWFGASIQEYPSSGHELDVVAVTSSGVTIYMEVIWAHSKTQFLSDINMLQQSDAHVKAVVVSPEILTDNEMVRIFEKVVISQRRQGKAIPGDMLDGQKILRDPGYVDSDLRHLLEDLVARNEKEQPRRRGSATSRRRFIIVSIATAAVAAIGYGYFQFVQSSQSKMTSTQTSQALTPALTDDFGLVTNGGFEDGMSPWEMGTGATSATAYVTPQRFNRGAHSLHLRSNEGVYQNLPATSLTRIMTLSYFVYFEPQIDLTPSSFVSLYTPDNAISRTFVVTRFPSYRSLPDQIRNLPNAVFRQFEVPFSKWIPISIDVTDFFTAAQQASFPLTRIGLESSNSSGLYYDDVKIAVSP